MRRIFGMNDGSVEAFQVVVVCQEIPPSCRIRRRVSRDSSATMPSATRWSRSLVSDQVEKPVMPHWAGDVRAIRQIHSRTWSPIFRGRPPLHFGSRASNPRSLNAWMTSRT
jgi:hypothetical protein